MTRMLEGMTPDNLIQSEGRCGVETDSRHSLRTGRRLMEDLNRPQHKKRSARKSKKKKDR